MVIEDEDKIKAKFDGRPLTVANFAHNLRMGLFKEHFGFDDKDLQDPVCDAFWNRAISTARVIIFVREIASAYSF